MEIRTIAAIAVVEPSQIAQARRMSATLARTLDFGEPGAGKAALAATELAANLVKHARDGELILNALEHRHNAGVEIIAIDRGPGMADPARCLQDGYSTAGSPGSGLGAVMRLAAIFDMHSVQGAGTAIMARLWRNDPEGPGSTERLRIGGISVPRPGEEFCGDQWRIRKRHSHYLLLVCDGLGHGPEAAEASREALRVLESTTHDSPKTILEEIHPMLRHTRGAAAGLADIDLERQLLRFAGVGNVRGVLYGGSRANHMISHNGTLGHEVRKIQEFSYPWPEQGLLVMHSDGLSPRSDLDSYPGLAVRHPGTVAAVLYRDLRRLHDDATVVVVQDAGEGVR